MSILEWAAAIVALAGAWLLRYRSADARQAGWACFLVSNLLWGAWGMYVGAWALVGMQCGFLVTSVLGLIATTKEKQ